MSRFWTSRQAAAGGGPTALNKPVFNKKNLNPRFEWLSPVIQKTVN